MDVDLRPWLAEHGLSMYADQLSEQHTVRSLAELDAIALALVAASAGLKRGHAVKLRKRLARLQSELALAAEQELREDELAIPEEYLCVITQALMKQPVITSDGHTYERAAISQWLETHATSPRTGNALPDKVLRPNHNLRAQIVQYRETHSLPAMELWEPTAQETVQTREATAAAEGAGAGGVPPGLQITPDQMVNVLGHLLGGFPQLQHTVGALLTQLGATPPPPGSDVLQATVGAIMQHQPVMEHVMAFVGQNAQAQQIFMQIMNAPDMPLQGQQGGSESPLFTACREGDAAVLGRLLGEVSTEELSAVRSPAGDSLLHVACWEGALDVVTMLLERGHDVHALSRNRSTPLHYAAWSGSLPLVRLLLEKGAETERRMEGGDTPLHQASWRGHAEVVSFLLASNADAAAQKDDGDTPLHLAALQAKPAVVKLLIEAALADTDETGLHLSSSRLATHAANTRRGTALHAAATAGCLESTTLLLRAGAAINARTSSDESPLHFAALSGHTELARLLLEKGASVDPARLEDGCTPLHMATIGGHVELAKLLLQKGASLTARTRQDGSTALHMAAVLERAELIEALVEAGASLNVTANDGLTPVHSAALQGRAQSLRLLLEKGADIDAKTTPAGETALTIAVVRNSTVVVALLLEQGALVDAQSANGNTALMLAAARGMVDCARLLVAAGADQSLLKNTAGHSASDLARQHGHTEVSRLLAEAAVELSEDLD